MLSRETRFRALVACFCIIGQVLGMAQTASATLLVALHGSHQAMLVEHAGHQDLLLHHDDDDDGSAADHGRHAESHAGHRGHHDHCLCISGANDAQDCGNDSWLLTHFFGPAMAGAGDFQGNEEQRAAASTRAPPPRRNQAIACLRTTVLLI